MDMPDKNASRHGSQTVTLSESHIKDFRITAYSPLYTIVVHVSLAFLFLTLAFSSVTGMWALMFVAVPVFGTMVAAGILDHVKSVQSAKEATTLMVKHYIDHVVKPALIDAGAAPIRHDMHSLKNLVNTGRTSFRNDPPDETSGAWTRLYHATIEDDIIMLSYDLVSSHDGELPGVTDEMIRRSRANASPR